MNLKNKKGQVWGVDLMIAVTIFVIGIIAIYVYALNFSSESTENLDSLFSEANLVSSLILSEGSPTNWPTLPESDVEIPGILSQNKINQTKLDNLYSLTESDYQSTRKLLGTSYNFHFTFPDLEASETPIPGIGKEPIDEENLVRIERFSIYKNKPAKITFKIWN